MIIVIIGAPGWTRTSDLRLRSPLLYPSELPGQAPTGAGAESRTPITSLENWDNNRYTTPATEVIITQLGYKGYISCSTVMRAPRLLRRAARSS